jgi:GNAT superfamily N-acetyltransferase
MPSAAPGAPVFGASAPAADPPEGIEIILFADRPELADGAYDVGREALPDIPGHEDWTPPPLEQFVESHLRGLGVFLAVADGEVVGYAKLRGHPDGRMADHGMTAVKRAWRGRGIAKSLKLAEIAWARANGIERLTASNEERTRRCCASTSRWAIGPRRGACTFAVQSQHPD